MKTHWIGVDFDGTLATWGCNWPEDSSAVGEPIPAMVERVKQWISEGRDVRIFTARMDGYHPTEIHVPAHIVRQTIEIWCLKHLGIILPVTNRKDYWCDALYDDKAIQVERDTGRLIEETMTEPETRNVLPTDASARKQIPVATGVLDYFPAALAEVAKISFAGNQQHNIGQALHWSRGKSNDHSDTMIRHFLERGTIDGDGQRHSAKMVWRALAILQMELEAEGAPQARGAK